MRPLNTVERPPAKRGRKQRFIKVVDVGVTPDQWNGLVRIAIALDQTVAEVTRGAINALIDQRGRV